MPKHGLIYTPEVQRGARVVGPNAFFVFRCRFSPFFSSPPEIMCNTLD